jgi:hypothetical protein
MLVVTLASYRLHLKAAVYPVKHFHLLMWNFDALFIPNDINKAAVSHASIQILNSDIINIVQYHCHTLASTTGILLM